MLTLRPHESIFIHIDCNYLFFHGFTTDRKRWHSRGKRLLWRIWILPARVQQQQWISFPCPGCREQFLNTAASWRETVGAHFFKIQPQAGEDNKQMWHASAQGKPAAQLPPCHNSFPQAYFPSGQTHHIGEVSFHIPQKIYSSRQFPVGRIIV